MREAYPESSRHTGYRAPGGYRHAIRDRALDRQSLASQPGDDAAVVLLGRQKLLLELRIGDLLAGGEPVLQLAEIAELQGHLEMHGGL